MTARGSFNADILKIDPEEETERIANGIRGALKDQIKRQGLVVALSGGVDSSVTAALCVRAVGKGRVFGLLLPERDSSEETLKLSRLITEHLGIDSMYEDITPVLQALQCYKRQEEAIRMVIPEYGPGYKAKILLPSVLDADRLRLFSVIVRSPEGKEKKARLSHGSYLGLVAATNFKQRVRKMFEYYHADRLNYAVAGTPNRLEYDQGFFVKLGDGSADIKPIAHLYKTQVYQLAEFLDIPEEIRKRPPTTDTYSMTQSQDEFYFSLPYAKMDLCLYGKNNEVPLIDVSKAIGFTAEQTKRIYMEIEQKRRTTKYLHAKPQLMGEVKEIGT